MAEVPSRRDVWALPDDIGCLETQHLAGPVTKASGHLVEFVLVRRKEHALRWLSECCRKVHLVERGQQKVPYTKELCRSDRVACDAPAQCVPIAVIDGCCRAVAIEQRINADW